MRGGNRMSRLIDADELMRTMYHRAFETDGDTMWQSGCWVRYRAIEQVVKEQPTIERKKGKWIIRDNPGTGWYRITCSECGEDVTSTAPCIGFFPNAKVIWDFCPWCGARMEKSDETQNT